MVTQNMLRTLEGIFFCNDFKLRQLKEIQVQISLHTRAPNPDLPSDVSPMFLTLMDLPSGGQPIFFPAFFHFQFRRFFVLILWHFPPWRTATSCQSV